MKPILILLFVLLTAIPTVLANECADADCDITNTTTLDRLYLEPDVRQLEPNYALIEDRDYYRVVQGENVQFYDTPDGTVIDSWKAGDNYLTVWEIQGEWGRVSADQWVRMAQLNKQNVVLSSFTGLLIDDRQPYPIAWSLVNQYASDEPGGDPKESNPFFYRYEYFYIYDTATTPDGLYWYQVGKDAWVHQYRVALYQPIERPEEINTERWVAIDLYEQVLIAYEGNTPVFTTMVSSGLPWWGTREGVFNVTWMRQREDMTQDLPDDFYYLQEVPWTAFFDNGIALHGTFWHDGFGFQQSHGCVNMSITDANWLYKFIEPEFDWTHGGGATVYVYNTDPLQ